MNRERFALIKRIFLEIRDLQPADHKTFLDEACAGDAALRSEVLALIDQPSQSLNILPLDHAGMMPDQFDGTGSRRSDVPSHIGPYRIVAVLGEGGMGVVYHAEQSQPVRREVALKIIRWGFGTQPVLARFESERQAIARMDHPNIARLFDAGSDETGNPYFVMELVRGLPITEYSRRHSLPVRERLQLFRSVCRATHDAHVKGIIHRDLKPSNILVAAHDGSHLAKIIDFGIAKAMEVTNADDIQPNPQLTMEGRLMGTLDYMSPEQATASPGGVDTRSDVYSLGVILYELLTGSLPYQLRNMALPDAISVIAHQEPPPMRRMGQEARSINGDLEMIVRKALEKDSSRRYSSAAELADDIDRYLASEPIHARPPTTMYQLRKLAGRHKVAAGFLITLSTFAVVLATVMSFQFEIQRRERRRAEIEAAKANRISEFLQGMLSSVDPGVRNVNIRVRDLLDDAARQLSLTLDDEPEVASALRRTLGNTYLGIGEYAKAEEQFTTALDLRTRTLGQDHLLVAESLQDIVTLMEARGFTHAGILVADSLCRRGLSIRRAALGEEHRDVAVSLSQLAKIRSHENHLQAAESLYVQAIDIAKKVHDVPLVADNLIAMSTPLFNMNREAEAESVLKLGVAAICRQYPGDHPGAADAMQQLGHFLLGRGQLAAGDSILKEVLAMELRMWGSSHPRVAQVLFALGQLRVDQGQFAEAESLYLKAFEMQIAFHGPSTLPAAQAYQNLGSFYWYRGDRDLAEENQARAIAIHRENNQQTWTYAMALNDLAVTLADQGPGRAEEAFALQREALRLFEQIWGPEHTHVGLANNNLAVFLLRRARLSESEPYLRRAIAIWSQPDRPPSAAAPARGNLGYLLHALDRLPEAEVEFRACIEALKGGPFQNTCLLCMGNLANCLYHQGRLEEAEEQFEEARAGYLSSLGEDYPHYAWILTLYGSLLLDAGRLDEAEPMLQKAIQKLDPNTHGVWIPWAQNALATCLAERGRPTEARSLFAESGSAAWTGIQLPPAAARIAHERYLRFTARKS